MSLQVFRFKDYRAYLEAQIGARGDRGVRAEFAQAMGCHSAYVTKILSGAAELSLEQAESLARHLALRPDETDYLLLLVGHARAGTSSLKQRYERQIEDARRRKLNLDRHLSLRQEMTSEQQAVYYSAWYYAAVHMICMIPEFRTSDAIRKRLRLGPKRINEILQFLLDAGLLEKRSDQYWPGKTAIHLEGDAVMRTRLHTNWRLRAIEALDRRDSTDLHYSGVASLSKDDVNEVREILIRALQKGIEKIQASKEEVLYCLAMDFFEV